LIDVDADADADADAHADGRDAGVKVGFRHHH
jgi:hypothetical protein